MEESKNQRIAILVDGDNAQAKLLKPILEEVSKYGKVTIRRIYGDWTTSHMNSWKEILNNLSFTPIQKFSYTSGKNSTDGALIIEAMDILHNRVVDGFCIVSSDSDYTGLAKRIREEGIFVMGIGEKKTPSAFIQSCEIFTYCENITSVKIPEQSKNSVKPVHSKRIEKVFPKVDLSLIDKAYEMSENEEAASPISLIGLNIRKIDPSFDVRAYGFSSLTRLFESLDQYKVIKNGANSRALLKRK